MKYCKSCGNKLEENDDVCPNCGNTDLVEKKGKDALMSLVQEDDIQADNNSEITNKLEEKSKDVIPDAEENILDDSVEANSLSSETEGFDLNDYNNFNNSFKGENILHSESQDEIIAEQEQPIREEYQPQKEVLSNQISQSEKTFIKKTADICCLVLSCLSFNPISIVLSASSLSSANKANSQRNEQIIKKHKTLLKLSWITYLIGLILAITISSFTFSNLYKVVKDKMVSPSVVVSEVPSSNETTSKAVSSAVKESSESNEETTLKKEESVPAIITWNQIRFNNQLIELPIEYNEFMKKTSCSLINEEEKDLYLSKNNYALVDVSYGDIIVHLYIYNTENTDIQVKNSMIGALAVNTENTEKNKITFFGGYTINKKTSKNELVKSYGTDSNAKLYKSGIIPVGYDSSDTCLVWNKSNQSLYKNFKIALDGNSVKSIFVSNINFIKSIDN